MQNNDCAWFVIPCYFRQERELQFFDRALESLFAQTDNNFKVVIIDDCSPCHKVTEHVKQIAEQHPEKVFFLALENNLGAGPARNAGIRYASERGGAFVLFNDADDFSAPDRLAICRSLFNSRQDIDVIYSTFNIVDENEKYIDHKILTPSIKEILDAHEGTPPNGSDAWLSMVTETGYVTLTSTIAVRMDLALTVPFPEERVSEDYHTWLRYSATGRGLYYLPHRLSSYRITSFCGGSSVRERVGERFYEEKARVDHLGFVAAANIAVTRGRLRSDQFPTLEAKFFMRLAKTMYQEGKNDLAHSCVLRAYEACSETATRIEKKKEA